MNNTYEIYVERVPHNGVFILSAYVTDPSDGMTFRHAVSYYFYDADEMDEMKDAFIESVKSRGWEFASIEEFD